jgi:hypothetical protein
MLTDKQIIALSLLKSTVDSQMNILYLARNIEGTKKLIDDALAVADIFLEASIPEPIPDEIISHIQANNQRLKQISDALLDSQYLESTLGD